VSQRGDFVLTNNERRGCLAETGPGHCIPDTMPVAGVQYARHNNLSPHVAPMRVCRIILPARERDEKKERERDGVHRTPFGSAT